MIKLFTFLISVFLIIIIFLRLPRESVGLGSFATQSDLLGSPRSAQKLLNIFTALGIFSYVLLAIKLNFSNSSI